MESYKAIQIKDSTEMAGISYNQFIYNDNGAIKIRSELLKLLQLTASKEITETINLNDGMSLNEFVKITQSIWIRQPNLKNRWEITESHYSKEVEEKVFDSLQRLNLLNEQQLAQFEYDGAVMLGSSISNLAKRFFHLQDMLLSKTKHFNNIYLMGSLEDITQYLATLNQIVKAYPDRFIDGVTSLEKANEHGIMEFFIKNLRWPDDFNKIQIIQLPSPMKQLNDRLVKPTTNDELNKLQIYLKEHNVDKNISKLAIFSHAPFAFRQNLIFLSIKDYNVIETTCNRHNSYEKLNDLSASAINTETALDELARLCYQLNTFVNVPDNIKLLGLQETDGSGLFQSITNDDSKATVSTIGMYGYKLKEAVKEQPTLHSIPKLQ